MIKGVHVTLYTPKAEELRAFLRDKLGLYHYDAGEGWLMFQVPEADLGCHPWDTVFQDVSFYCDDIEETVSKLKEQGVEFTSEITEEEWGWTTTLRMPGEFEVMLYQPRYVK